MNDRFKFRVWNKLTHSFTTGGAIKFGGLCFVDEEDLGIKLGEHQELYVIEQCTGLKDKNGNLIYEGDIIHEVDKEADIDDVSQIVWNQETCHFMKLDLPETGLDRHCILCEDDRHYIEIIGNIHEQVEQNESSSVHNKIEFPEYNDNLLEEFDKQFFENGQDDDLTETALEQKDKR